MKKALTTIVLLVSALQFSFAQLTPEITSWVLNLDSSKGYGGYLSNVQHVQYSDDFVYISCTCIPGYDIGPWSNPNVAENQNFVYKIPRHPVVNTGTRTAIDLGHIGVWSNGVSIFNASDAQTYNNDGVWHRNGYYFEYPSFDNCLGHAQQQGEYHHHVSPKCLYDQTDSTHHSPIIGYMFDGYPVYGAYGYADTNGTGGIRRMRTSWQLRNMTDRTTLPDGSTASVAGPSFNTVPDGDLLEDYILVPGSGDLDSNNGRFCKTPEYPDGTYAYFVTIDSTLAPQYPYTAASYYHGVVTSGNTGMNSGHQTISEAVTSYTPSITGLNAPTSKIDYMFYPNPVKDYAFIYFQPSSPNNIQGNLYNEVGQLVQTVENLQPSISYTFNMTNYPSGVYFLHLTTNKQEVVQKIIKTE